MGGSLRVCRPLAGSGRDSFYMSGKFVANSRQTIAVPGDDAEDLTDRAGRS
jgi:hypothetical protein